jgi:hypothetical protein
MAVLEQALSSGVAQLYIARRSRSVTTPATLSADVQHAIGSPLPGIRVAPFST